MGSLSLPTAGRVYLDASCVIYAVERVAPFDALLAPLWRAAADARLKLVSSELTVLETLVKPLRDDNTELESDLRAFLFESTEFRLVPIDLPTIEHAARLRATIGLKTPDAIHAASALGAEAALLVTNDSVFRRVQGLNVAVLSDLLEGSA